MNPIVRLAASALPGEKKYILFAGAGVSKDAGVPTSWDLMLKTASLLYAADTDRVDPDIDLEKWFVNSKYAEMKFSELIEMIYPNYPDQQDFLKQYLGNKEIGDGHRGIAELARRGIIRAIITTNFDHCLEKALEEKGLEPQVISTDEDLENSEPLIHCKSVRVYKPHGDLGRGALKNTPRDLEELSPLMEEELIRILSQHGIMVLGYSGSDRDMQEVFRKRNHRYYPLFWINPSPPEGEIEAVLKMSNCTFVPCTGAGQFLDDFLNLLQRLRDLAPATRLGPTIPDLRHALSVGEPVKPPYSDYLEYILNDLERIRPDFSKFDEHDDAIVTQIEEGMPISCRFIEAALLASKYNNSDAIRVMYDFFGSALRFYEVPDSFTGTFRETDFDGYKFLVYEMFVSLIAALMKSGSWEIIGEILQDDLFVENEHESRYSSFAFVSQYTRSLDEIRNKRLNLNRVSLMADLLKERFTQDELSHLITHKEFLEADYFLFMRTISHEENPENSWDIWWPRSCVYLKWVPTYLVKAESKRFLEMLTKAIGFDRPEEFVRNFSRGSSVFTRPRFNPWRIDPLANFDFSRLGIRQ
ncbi:MAG: SIR2 family protein [Candidatus Methanofastidiosia archaeon]